MKDISKITAILLICLNLAFCAAPHKKLQKAQEKDPQYQCNMGLFYLNEGNVEEAIRYLNKALALKPDYDNALCSLGLAYSMKQDFKESIKYLQKCLAINPSLTEAHNYLGVAYQEMGLLDEAEREFRIAIMDHNYKSRELPYYNLARIYLTRERLQEALEYLEKSLEINRNFRLAHNLKGVILEMQLKYSDAIESYKNALQNLDVKANTRSMVAVDFYVNINFNLAVAYFKNNEFGKAREIFEKIRPMATDPDIRVQIEQYLRVLKKEK